MAIDASFEKTLPNNLEAERAVLSVVLLNEKAIFTASETLRPEDFYLESHRIIFKRALDLTQESHGLDQITILHELQRYDELEKCGGAAYVASLTDGMPRNLNIQHYVQIVREQATLRHLIQLSNETMQRAYQAEERPAQIIESMEAQIFKLASRERKDGFQPTSELASAVYKQIEEAANKKSIVTGLPTGFTDLDHMTGGMQPQDLMIVAARPGLGKTSLCLNVSAHVAIRLKKPIGIFSLEMSKHSLVKRMISSESRVDAHKIRAGFLNKEEWNRLTRATGEIDQAPIYMDDSANLTLMQIRAKAQRLMLEHGIELLIVDYLQLVSGSGRRHENRTQEVTEISRGLKNLAKELNIPVIAVSQLNRDVEKRAGGRGPQLSDLRESGAIEQDADLVLFISRQEMCNPTEDNSGLADITIAKQRNGPSGVFQLTFLKQYTRFEDLYQESLNYG
jgi:replicative DNA helicase